MELFDIGLVLVMLLPALVGVIYGFLNMLLSMVSWMLALGIALKFSSAVSPMLSTWIETEIFRSALAFIGLFIVSLMIFTAIGYFMVKLLGRSGLTAADRVLGLLFGGGLGAAIAAVVVFLAGFTDVPRAVWWQQSMVVGPFERSAIWAQRYLPEDVAKYHSYHDQKQLTQGE